MMNLLSTFLSTARLTPEKTLLRHDASSISYGEMALRVSQTAGVLHAQGVKRGDRVAAMCFNTPAFVDFLLGAWSIGAAVVPVNHKLQAPELQYILAHSGSAVLLFDASLAAVVARVEGAVLTMSTQGQVPGVLNFDSMRDAATPRPGIEPQEDQLAEILYTSGTTGKPKGCMLNHRSVTMAAISAALAVSVNRNDRVLVAMPIWHSSPLNNWFGGSLYVGATVVLLREYHPQRFLQVVQDERVTVYFGAPVSYFAPMQAVPDFGDYDLTSVRAWIYGGGPIGADMARKLAQAYRSDGFYQVYGMTETGPVGTTLLPQEQVAKAGSIGRIGIPGVDLRVVRQDGGDALPGEVGEIWLRAASTMQGYLDDEAATRAVLSPDGWYRSGDIARLDVDGYLFIADRAKDMIVTGGENVYSKEVEDVLGTHPAVADVAVVGQPHPEWGETVVAHVVLKPGQGADPAQLAGFLSDKLARYKIPRVFRLRDALPRTPTGKLQKFLLRGDTAQDLA
jgi:feruloyl-CoA synthase